jgi:endonuclease/exonuclease/phosphatase family metal-dependent hydrolase
MLIKMVKLLTYNIWFDDYELINRTIQICKIIIKEDPDFISLQEVTSNSFSILKKYLGHYYFSKNEIILPYDILILSKTKINKIFTMPFKNSHMMRSYHFIISSCNNIIFKIIGIHLESNFKKNIKYDQLQFIMDTNNNFDMIDENVNAIIIMGDTNIEKEIELNGYNFNDLWIKDGSILDKKYTFDYLNNINIKGKYRSRLDRIWINTYKEYIIEEFKFIGNKKMNNLLPSDHFGLIASILI